ncbi:hypothetical protein JCM9140_918 [Halalkalibacter wakoensis JCM 9140]|uniref:Uncharacterized protein n=1 Tax=Halalkalibacter wakoensis JCM 9140 TaxID=1236970 RepID=W4PZ09_9BACI|nr:hypothetical protein [Halalkalibacter wakoensis]GAE24952.1 hypothetical protein JCM9140_918 [Halalkalibacter wakoensis JCM 9140]
MKHFLEEYRYIIYTFVLFLFVANTFLDNKIITYVVGVLAIPMLFISFLYAAKLFRVLGLIFLLVGGGLFVYSGLPFYELPLFFTSTMPLLSFLAVLPWMNSVVRSGRFDRRINELMKTNISSLGNLYTRSSLTTYILCTYINLSALSISQEVLQDNMGKMKKKLRDSFISQSTLRAFSLALAWSPMEVIVAITVDGTGVSYVTFLPWLLLCSFTVLFIDLVWGKRKYGSMPYEQSEANRKQSLSFKQIFFHIVKLTTALSIFLVIVVSIGNYFELNFILSVTLVILPFSFIWAWLMKRFRSFVVIGWSSWKLRTNGMQNFVVLFLTLAFFSSSLNETPFLQFIQQPFFAAADHPLLILFLIQLTYLVMSMIGVHPIATIGILLEALPPLFEIINPLSIGIVLITGALATATVGTYGVTVTITAMNTNQSPYRITVRNLPFALLYGGVGTLIGFFILYL